MSDPAGPTDTERPDEPTGDPGTNQLPEPSTEQLEEPSTEKEPSEEPKAPEPDNPEPSHEAVGIGVIDDEPAP